MAFWQNGFLSKLAAQLVEPTIKKSWIDKYKETLYLYDFGREDQPMLAPVNDILNFDTEETETILKNMTEKWQSIENYDMLLYKIVEYVKNNITYKRDFAVYSKLEYWQMAKETLDKGTGDCEDMAILCYKLARAAGVPAWRLQLCIGTVRGGGHCWLQIISPNTNDLINCDAAYWPEQSMANLLLGISASENENYIDIWCAFNEEGIYARHDSNFTAKFITET